MKVRTKIQKWGNSLGLRISGPMKTVPNFEENMPVDVNVTEKGLEVVPVKKIKKRQLPFTEAELLEDMTPYGAHADEIENVYLDKEWGDD